MNWPVLAIVFANIAIVCAVAAIMIGHRR